MCPYCGNALFENYCPECNCDIEPDAKPDMLEHVKQLDCMDTPAHQLSGQGFRT